MTNAGVPLAPRRSPLLPPVSLGIYLDADDENDVLDQLADEIADEWWGDIDAAFPDGDTAMVHPLPAPERFANYMMLTRPQDLPMLLDPDYFRQVTIGLADPLPVYISRATGEAYTGPDDPATVEAMVAQGLIAPSFWGQIQSEVPRDFKRTAGDFRRLFNQYANQRMEQRAPVPSRTTSPAPASTNGGY